MHWLEAVGLFLVTLCAGYEPQPCQRYFRRIWCGEWRCRRVGEIEGAITEISAEEVASELKDAKEVMIVPGYGMAVAQAQHVVKDITETLRSKEAMSVLRSIPLPEDFLDT